ncbi:MAG: alpha/beta hydrolase [Chloroflexia bacterium]|nr:alpha/beta hydrolase [Chloroflexia bacterium]
MQAVTSQDGTTIASDRSGSGPALILVYGATGVRSHPMWTDLVSRLEPHFTVYSYDRRGRGDSGDTAPYAVDREIEDLAAVVDAAGGSAHLYGISSGAVLALDAANALKGRVTKLALYEPPFILDDSRAPLPGDYVAQLDAAIAGGQRGDAVEIFMTQAVGIPAEYLDGMKADPWWAETEAVAHTIAYDGRVMGDTMSGQPLPPGKWDGARMPTLVMTGGNSEPFFHDSARALVSLLPDASHRTLAGQDHGIAGEALAPVLVEFFNG